MTPSDIARLLEMRLTWDEIYCALAGEPGPWQWSEFA